MACQSISKLLIAVVTATLLIAPVQAAATSQEGIIQDSEQILQNTAGLKIQSIPDALLADAEAVAIVPNVVKVALVAGGRHGRGVLIVRDQDRRWSLPTFVELTGGSVGWQLGIQATDVVLVFKNRERVEDILEGRKFTLGADGSVAAGPVGRQVSAATDEQLRAEVYSYSRSRGLFAGVALDGSVISVDAAANAAFYSNPGSPPQSSIQLVQTLEKLCGAPAAGVTSVATESTLDAALAASRSELAAAHKTMETRLDATWQKYLALPPGIEINSASLQKVTDVLGRYDRVAADERYQALTSTSEFQQTHALLGAYLAHLHEAAQQPVALPPPPEGP